FNIMKIKYYLQSNPITANPNDRTARVLTNDVYQVDNIILQMLERGTTVTEADIRAVLNVFFTVVSDLVARGSNVNLPLVNIRPGITGIFSDQADSFDPARHTKKANVSPGTLLLQKLKVALVEKVN